MVPVLEFWPDYGRGPLWRDGEPVDPAALGLPDSLTQELVAHNAAYREDRVPLDGPGEPEYLAVGAALLQEVRAALVGRYEVVTSEPWWET